MQQKDCIGDERVPSHNELCLRFIGVIVRNHKPLVVLRSFLRGVVKLFELAAMGEPVVSLGRSQLADFGEIGLLSEKPAY